MIELDFLFIYEHKVRELEALCLFKYELDKRGYKTKIVYVDDAENACCDVPKYHAKVLCVMACYDNYTLFWHTKEFVKFDKVIDLQWENIVYPGDEEREDAHRNYWDVGKEVVHLSWGPLNVQRLINIAHVDERKVKMVGHAGMDYLREPLIRYYDDRKTFFPQYDIDLNSKVILFASPYYGDRLSPEYQIGMVESFGPKWPEYYDFMRKSQNIVLEWFEEYCEGHKNSIVVFRPHPGHPCYAALELEKRCPNFRVIGEKSVKQWIAVCDKVYTGNSTVVIEAFFANKDCQLLFPLSIPEDFELELIAKSKKITSKNELLLSIDNNENEFPTPENVIRDIYYIDDDKYAFQLFADMAEEVWKDPYYNLSSKWLKAYKEYTKLEWMIKKIIGCKGMNTLYHRMLDNQKLQWRWLENQRKLREKNKLHHMKIEQDHAHELLEDGEIDRIINRIQSIFL